MTTTLRSTQCFTDPHANDAAYDALRAEAAYVRDLQAQRQLELGVYIDLDFWGEDR